MIDTVSEALPIAKVHGQALLTMPLDLYIPPDALEVFLQTFEGPLDLLLYLIRKQNLDILDIPMAELTRQYQQYIELMQGLKLELAAEYLLMAAMLTEIKSRFLLPKPVSEHEEEDPRAELVRRLKEYEQFKQAAENLDALPRLERDFLLVAVDPPEIEAPKAFPTVDLPALVAALADVLRRAEWRTPHFIRREVLTVRERMSRILQQLQEFTDFTSFEGLLDYNEGRVGVVVTFIAVLELLKQSIIEIVQTGPFAAIHIKMVHH